MNTQMVGIRADESFSFSCGKAKACFGACCRNLNHFLTPFDILKIRQALQLTSAQFLERYTVTHTGPRSGLPIVSWIFKALPDAVCPFLTRSGCAIYPVRPTSCRLYPLARAFSRNRETGRTSVQFALIREPFCLGFESETTQSPEEWIAEQGTDAHIRMNDRLLDLIALRNRSLPRPLTRHQKHRVYMALYDQDRFRTEVKQGRLGDFPTDPDLLKSALADEMALLELGHQWAAHALAHPLGKEKDP